MSVKIRITLGAREASDNPSILTNVAKSFPEAESVDINIRDTTSEEYQRNEILEIQAHSEAKHVLDKNAEVNLEKIREPVSPEVIKEKNINWFKLFAEQGIRVVIKEAYDKIAEQITNLL